MSPPEKEGERARKRAREGEEEGEKDGKGGFALTTHQFERSHDCGSRTSCPGSDKGGIEQTNAGHLEKERPCVLGRVETGRADRPRFVT